MSGRRRPIAALVVMLVAVGAVGAAGAGCAAGDPVAARGVDRVVIVSLPGTNWADVRDGNLPALRRFIDGAAVGDLATRIGRRPEGAADAYLTMGAGTRAVAYAAEAGVAVERNEAYGGQRAGDVVRVRTGSAPPAVTYLAAKPAVEANEHSQFGAQVGLLGELLRARSIGRAVIANGDRSAGPEAWPDFERAAVTALMTPDGGVPRGAVGPGLLATDPQAPYGVRLDIDAVGTRFAEAWNDHARRKVVLVEASDLLRVASYRPLATPAQYRRAREGALAASDRLLAAVLRHVDPARDGVMVVAPLPPPGAPRLGLVAVSTPSIDGGLLRSATTRRDGYVQLSDVMPTVLAMLGERPPEGIEGRPFRVAGGGGSPADRIDALDRAVTAAEFRDGVVATVSLLFVGALVLLAAAWVVLILRAPAAADRWRRGVRLGALGVLGAVPATYLAGLVTFDSLPPYLAFVVLVGAALAALAAAADRRRLGPIVAVGLIVAVIAGDIALGGNLQLNTVFGYSVAVGGRFAGVGNLAYALLASAALVGAVLASQRFGRRGARWAVAAMTIVVLVDGLPFLGGDVGGVVSMVPSFAVAAVALRGRTVEWRHWLGAAGAAVVVLLGFGFLDLARPAPARTHLARIAEHVVDLRWAPIANSAGRRWQASFGTAALSGWVLVGLAALAVSAYLAVVATGRRRPGGHRVPAGPARALAYGLPLLATLGLVANDSSFAVPGVMLIVVVPAALLWLLEHPPAWAGPGR